MTMENKVLRMEGHLEGQEGSEDFSKCLQGEEESSQDQGKEKPS